METMVGRSGGEVKEKTKPAGDEFDGFSAAFASPETSDGEGEGRKDSGVGMAESEPESEEDGHADQGQTEREVVVGESYGGDVVVEEDGGSSEGGSSANGRHTTLSARPLSTYIYPASFPDALKVGSTPESSPESEKREIDALDTSRQDKRASVYRLNIPTPTQQQQNEGRRTPVGPRPLPKESGRAITPRALTPLSPQLNDLQRARDETTRDFPAMGGHESIASPKLDDVEAEICRSSNNSSPSLSAFCADRRTPSPVLTRKRTVEDEALVALRYLDSLDGPTEKTPRRVPSGESRDRLPRRVDSLENHRMQLHQPVPPLNIARNTLPRRASPLSHQYEGTSPDIETTDPLRRPGTRHSVAISGHYHPQGGNFPHQDTHRHSMLPLPRTNRNTSSSTISSLNSLSPPPGPGRTRTPQPHSPRVPGPFNPSRPQTPSRYNTHTPPYPPNVPRVNSHQYRLNTEARRQSQLIEVKSTPAREGKRNAYSERFKSEYKQAIRPRVSVPATGLAEPVVSPHGTLSVRSPQLDGGVDSDELRKALQREQSDFGSVSTDAEGGVGGRPTGGRMGTASTQSESTQSTTTLASTASSVSDTAPATSVRPSATRMLLTNTSIPQAQPRASKSSLSLTPTRQPNRNSMAPSTSPAQQFATMVRSNVSERQKSRFLLTHPDATFEELVREARRYAGSEEEWNLHNDILAMHGYALHQITSRHKVHAEQLRQLLANSEVKVQGLQTEVTKLKEEKEGGETGSLAGEERMRELEAENKRLVESAEREKKEKGALKEEVERLRGEVERKRSVWGRVKGRMKLGRAGEKVGNKTME
ncbi:hypothetical protein BJ508DRAFT_117519 [Ascobolus immersus RN42]|uniref:Uncharacterized protein n=1 Tax=Ascobolus immersus RN42 TaxID=1160509 RepID=A0A3N4I4G6_ASCIM|nr:hypothetical protein BJ508DRAFT_117519 [Ascobolus immersus RN42]